MKRYSARCVLIAILFLSILGLSVSVRAQANAIVPYSSFGNPSMTVVTPNDDGSTGLIPFGFNINFYGVEYSGAYLNTNGNVTFTGPLSTYTPFGLASAGIPIIAPFFADVDTSVSGSNPITYGVTTLNGNSVFVATWPGVDCFINDNKKDYFQLILIDRPDLGVTANGDSFDIEFNYNSIQWDAGQASGGDGNCQSQTQTYSAVVGFSNGTPAGSFQLPGSQVNGAFIDGGPDSLISNSQNSNVLGQYIFPVVAGLPATPNTLTVTEAGQGDGNVSDGMEGGIDCTDTNGAVTGTCSTNYPNPTQVTLTATLNSDSTTFGGWGGACASAGMSLTCNLTMTSSQNVSAVFNAPGPTQGGQVNPGQPNPTVYSYGGGFSQDDPKSGYDFTGQETSQQENQAAEMTVTAIPQVNQQVCNTIVDASFPGAQCFVYQNGGGQGVDVPVMFEVTCPDSPGGTCGTSLSPDFFATLGSDFNFTCAENSPLCVPYSTFPYDFGFPNLTSLDGLPAIGFLKGAGPDPNHPCTQYPQNNPALFLSNQIASFNLVDPGSKPVVAKSGGTGSCWLVTYLTPGELPTVSITAPVPNGTYTQGQATQANYTCNSVNTGSASTTGPYLTVSSCTATDSPGGAVGQGAQFDTSTVGPHKFTAYVQDSATNTNSSTVTYTVVAAPATTSGNTATFMQGTPGSFTITTTGYPAPSLSYSPAGALPSGVSFMDKGNGTATISGTPTVSGLFSFWVKASNGVGNPALQNFSLTVNSAITMSPTSISYGNVVVGQSAKNYVTLTNKSSNAIGIGPVTFTVTSGNKSQFSLGQACPASLQPGTSCSIGAVFAPVAAGAGAATLNIPTSVSSTPQSVSLSGTGINPQASFSPTSLPFGTIKVGKSSTLGVTLTNTGTSALAISSVTVTGANAGNFTKSNPCPSSLAAGTKCTISVTFTPSATGLRSASLIVADNASPGTQTVPLSGTGN